MSQDVALWMLVACGIALCGIGIGLPMAILWFRYQPPAPIDWGDIDAAHYRREAILRDETAQRTRQTKLGDRRRRTEPTTGVIQTIPETIRALPLRDKNLG